MILRFQRSERLVHWAVAIPFLICYATAFVLVTVYNVDPSRPYRSIFSWTHRASALCLIVLPALTLFRHRRDRALHLDNIRTAWRWRRDDVRWLLLMGPATFNRLVALPPQEKFNAAEKINFMVLTATVPLYALTGLMIWLHGAAYVSWLLHLSMAAVATPLLGGHIFMATINPDTRTGLSGMITGYVDRHWASHHYAKWYRDLFESPGQQPSEIRLPEALDPPASADATDQTSPAPPVVAIPQPDVP